MPDPVGQRTALGSPIPLPCAVGVELELVSCGSAPSLPQQRRECHRGKVTYESRSPGKVGRLRPSQVTADFAVLARDSHCEVEGWGPDLWRHGPSLRLLLEEA